ADVHERATGANDAARLVHRPRPVVDVGVRPERDGRSEALVLEGERLGPAERDLAAALAREVQLGRRGVQSDGLPPRGGGGGGRGRGGRGGSGCRGGAPSAFRAAGARSRGASRQGVNRPRGSRRTTPPHRRSARRWSSRY